MKAKIQDISSEINGRIIAISDIHGYVSYLDELLKKVQFTKDDALVIIGDLIEKGPESLQTVRYVMDLRKKYPYVYVSMGNVEYYRLFLFADDSGKRDDEFIGYLQNTRKVWRRGLFLDMLDELGIELDSVQASNLPEIKKKIRQRFGNELDFLMNLPTIICAGNYLFVHAGVSTDRIEVLKETDAFSCLRIDAYLEQEISLETYVVVGHWPVCLYNNSEIHLSPILDREKHVIAIDGGCALKSGAQLNAIMIPGKEARMEEIRCEYYSDAPVLIADRAQSEVKSTVNIRYMDSEVELLEDLVDIVKLRHKSSGSVFIAVKSFLYRREEKLYCEDCDDSLLEIHPGDRLELIEQTSIGALVKKEGRIGWYKNR